MSVGGYQNGNKSIMDTSISQDLLSIINITGPTLGSPPIPPGFISDNEQIWTKFWGNASIISNDQSSTTMDDKIYIFQCTITLIVFIAELRN